MYQPMKRGRERAADLIESSGYGKPHMAHGGHEDFAQDAAMIKKAVAEHEKHDHPGEKPTRLHFRDGGAADGDMAPRRLDHKARGGKSVKGRAKNQVNIVIAPHPGMGGGPGGPGGPPGMMAGPPPGAMPPHPPMPPPAPPSQAMPPRPPMGAGPMPGAPPGGMGMPGGMAPRPMGIKTGGRARRQDGGMPPQPGMPGGQPPTPQQMAAMKAAGGMPAGVPGTMPTGGPTTTPGGTATPMAKRGGREHRKDGGSMGDGGIGGSPRMTAGAGSGEGRREKMDREHSDRWGDGV